jgi:hypothetical protein
LLLSFSLAESNLQRLVKCRDDQRDTNAELGKDEST